MCGQPVGSGQPTIRPSPETVTRFTASGRVAAGMPSPGCTTEPSRIEYRAP